MIGKYQTVIARLDTRKCDKGKYRRAVEELGWSVQCGSGRDAEHEPTNESETAVELQYEEADFIPQESSANSTREGSTGKSRSAFGQV